MRVMKELTRTVLNDGTSHQITDIEQILFSSITIFGMEYKTICFDIILVGKKGHD